MKLLLLILAIIITCLEASPLNKTLTTTTTSTKSTNDIYDDYDEKYYKDYYSDDYLAEVAAKDEKKEASLNTSSVPTLTTTKKILSHILPSTLKPLTINSVTPKTKTNTTYNDLSDYYDDYMDYYDEDDKFAYTKFDSKVLAVGTTTKIGLNANKTLAKKWDTIEDYNYDYVVKSSTVKTKVLTVKVAKVPVLNIRNKLEIKPISTKTSTTNSVLLAKSTKTKTDEYDEYYEDEYYQDNEKDNYDYYADDYKYYDSVEANNTETDVVAKLTDKTIDNSTIVTTTVDPFFDDDYDLGNYDEYGNDTLDYYDYESIFDEVKTTKKPVNESATVEVITTTRTTKIATKSIIPVDILNKALEPTTPKLIQAITTSTKPTTITIPTTTTTTTTTLKPLDTTEDTFYYKESEYLVPTFKVSDPDKPNQNLTSFRGDLRLNELIKSPALLAGIFGGLLIGLVTAILLLIFIIYRIRQRKYDQALQYDLDTKLTCEKKTLTEHRRQQKRVKLKKAKKRTDPLKQTALTIDEANNQMLSSSQMSTPSNNAGSTNSKTGLLNTGHGLLTASRLLKYEDETVNIDGSFNYAYIKAPARPQEFYA